MDVLVPTNQHGCYQTHFVVSQYTGGVRHRTPVEKLTALPDLLTGLGGHFLTIGEDKSRKKENGRYRRGEETKYRDTIRHTVLKLISVVSALYLVVKHLSLFNTSSTMWS